MRILLVFQYFGLPSEPGGSRAYQFARRWAAQGHDVTVLAGNLNYKTGRTYPCDRGRSWSVEDHPDGFRLYRIWAWSDIRGSFRKRLLLFGTFAAHASLAGSILPKPDVVFASSTPLFVGIPGWLLARRFRVPFVFELRDLWPEAAVAAGILKDRRVIDRAQGLARFLYRRADHLIAVTAGIREGLLGHGNAPESVTLVPNGVDDWMDPDRFRGRSPLPEDLRGRFVCLYVGAHGLWNNLETLLAAARELKEDPTIAFAFVGDGDRRRHLERTAREWGLDNVRFLGALPKEEAFAAMTASDVGLIAASDHPHNRQTLPNKIFDYMAAELPVVVAAGEGEMRELLEVSGGGWAAAPEDGAALAAVIRRARDLAPEARRAVGEAGRRHVLEHYDRPRLADRVLGVFERVTGSGAGSAVPLEQSTRRRA